MYVFNAGDVMEITQKLSKTGKGFCFFSATGLQFSSFLC